MPTSPGARIGAASGLVADHKSGRPAGIGETQRVQSVEGRLIGNQFGEEGVIVDAYHAAGGLVPVEVLGGLGCD